MSSAGGGTNVVVRMVLKLVRQSSGGIIASTTAAATIQSASDAVPDVVAAFDMALGKVLKQSVGWVLREGAADRKRYVEE